MLKLQLVVFLSSLAAVTHVQAGVTDAMLVVAIEARFPGVKVTEVDHADQKEIGDLVDAGKDIPIKVLDKYNAIIEFTLDGKIFSANAARYEGGGVLKGKPVGGVPEANDTVFQEMVGFGVEEECQKFIGQVADAGEMAIKTFAIAKAKEIDAIEVGVESAGYSALKKSYNVSFYRVHLKN